MELKRTTTVKLAGRGLLKLRPADHVATGGEGSIYRAGQTAIKLYRDTDKMAREGMVDKITQLAKMDHPYVVAPQGIVADTSGKPIGWYMDYSAGEPLARVFTGDWRTQHVFGDQEATIVAERMHQVVTFAHSRNAVMADANELNWTVTTGGPDGPEPHVLDVDSWAIGRWPARAIMPSIRDWQAATLTESSDWFAWGVVTFQLYTGIHPYKGTLAGYKPSDLQRRMRDNASVFAPGVRLNRAVRDFRCIPQPLLEWYKATFADGRRTIPPSPQQAAAGRPTVMVRRPASAPVTASITYERLYDGARDAALQVYACGVVLLESGQLFDLATRRVIGVAPSREAEVVRVEGGWLVATVQHGRVVAEYIGTSHVVRPVESTLEARQLVRYGDRLFAVTGQGLSELEVHQLGRILLTPSRTWGALASTQWFGGLGIQDVLGAKHLIAPFGDQACAHVRVPELDRLRPVAARAGQRFVVITALAADGTYRRLELSFNRDYTAYAVDQTAVDEAENNTALLPRGVAASIQRDGELAIYVPSTGVGRVVADASATTEFKLAAWGDRVVAVRQGDVWSLRL